MSNETEVYLVGELIVHLKEMPADAVVMLAICEKRSHDVRHAHCARDFLQTVDFAHDGKTDEPIMDVVLLHGAGET